MEPPAADSSTGSAAERAGIDLESYPGVIDFQARERRAELLNFAVAMAPVGQRYVEVHQDLFGFSIRRILGARNQDFAALEARLGSIGEDADRIAQALEGSGLDGLPRHSKTAIAFRDALTQYVASVCESAAKLQEICRRLDGERWGRAELARYRETRFKSDRADYDASVQEFRRWGSRLTDLTRRF